MHRHPPIGARVFVRPTSPAVPVQRGAETWNQMLAPEGQECQWDDYLQRRHEEGSVQLADEHYQELEAARRKAALSPEERADISRRINIQVEEQLAAMEAAEREAMAKSKAAEPQKEGT